MSTNETKHTPGDWLNSQGYIVCKGGYTVAHVNSHNTTEGSANADLIARAPALLAENEALRAHNAELVRVLQAAVSVQMPISVKMGSDWDNPFPETYRDAWVMEAKVILAKVQA